MGSLILPSSSIWKSSAMKPNHDRHIGIIFFNWPIYVQCKTKICKQLKEFKIFLKSSFCTFGNIYISYLPVFANYISTNQVTVFILIYIRIFKIFSGFMTIIKNNSSHLNVKYSRLKSFLNGTFELVLFRQFSHQTFR